MYLAHFGLLEFPFGITPDTQFIYSATAHQEALNTLLVALQGGEGFVKITGEVGTGKTLVCRRFLSMLEADVLAAYIPNPQMEPQALLASVAEELDTAIEAADAAQTIKRINSRLLELAAAGRRVVLCIDEAQTMPAPTLESLRLLSNLETEKRKLIHIVLFGQPELDDMLAARSARQLRQRIAFHYRMPPLGRAELDRYVDHRLHVAGHRGESLFAPRARRTLYRHSGGTPRLVNILAHKAMLSAFGEGHPRVCAADVLSAVRDTEGARPVRWWQLAW